MTPLGRLAPFKIHGSQPHPHSTQSKYFSTSLHLLLCKDNSKYSPLFSDLQSSSFPPRFKLMTLFPTSLREEIGSECHIFTSHPQIYKPLCNKILSSFLFQWGEFSIPLLILWTPSTFPEHFRNLLSLPSLTFNTSHSIYLFLSAQTCLSLSHLGGKKENTFL